MWEALKAELLPFSVALSSASIEPQDVEIVKEALSCLSSWVLAFQIEKDSSMNDSGIMETGDFLRLVLQDGLVEDLISYLENFTGSQGHAEPAMKDRAKHQSEAAGRVLAEAARACPSSCFMICRQVLPRLMAASGLMAEEKASILKECIAPGNEVGVISSPELPLVHASNTSPTCIGASVGEVITHQRSGFGLDVLLQLVIAARILAEKLSQEHDQSGAMTSKKWLDPVREQSENLISAFHQAITDEWSEVSSVLGGKFSREQCVTSFQLYVFSGKFRTLVFVVF